MPTTRHGIFYTGGEETMGEVLSDAERILRTIDLYDRDTAMREFGESAVLEAEGTPREEILPVRLGDAAFQKTISFEEI